MALTAGGAWSRSGAAAIGAFMVLVGCGPSAQLGSGSGEEAEEEPAVSSLALLAHDDPDALDVGTWNLCWYGSTFGGPSDELKQQRNVASVLHQVDLDLFALVEVSGAYDVLRAALPDHDLVLVEDARVVDGSAYGAAQKVALALRRSAGSIVSARALFPSHAETTFSGRLPLEVRVALSRPLQDGATELTAIVVHLKAGEEAASWAARERAAALLKAHLAGPLAGERVLVLGDFNDDVDGSLTSGKSSPFTSLSSSFFVSEALSRAGRTTSLAASQTHMLDHLLVSSSLKPLVVPSGTEILRPDAVVADYRNTTSDHLPLAASLAQRVDASRQVLINEVLINEPGLNRSGEFVELVNAGTQPMDLSGWTLSDSTAVRHVFPAGTRLASKRALVVTGGNASSGQLSLSNSGDIVSLKDSAGTAADALRYGAAAAARDGVSFNRAVDGDRMAPFALHDGLSTRANSPGTQLDGSAF